MFAGWHDFKFLRVLRSIGSFLNICCGTMTLSGLGRGYMVEGIRWWYSRECRVQTLKLQPTRLT